LRVNNQGRRRDVCGFFVVFLLVSKYPYLNGGNRRDRYMILSIEREISKCFCKFLRYGVVLNSYFSVATTAILRAS
jgi:hypothetical protein